MILGGSHFDGPVAGGFTVVDKVEKEGWGVRQLVFDTQPDAEQSCVYLKFSVSYCVAPNAAVHQPVVSCDDDGQAPGARRAAEVASKVQPLPPLAIVHHWKLCHDLLYFEVHRAAVAGLALIPPAISKHHFWQLKNAVSPLPTSQSRTGDTVDRLLVLGLGGGALPMFLRHHFPGFAVDCCEIDPVVYGVACSHFGFAPSSDSCPPGTRSLRVFVGDAAAHVHRLSTTIHHRIVEGRYRLSQQLRYRMIFLDVDDNSHRADGLLCPPISFLTETFLADLQMCLHQDFGIVSFNIASRSKATFQRELRKIRDSFDQVFLLPVIMDDELDPEFQNAIVFALIVGREEFCQHLDSRPWRTLGQGSPRGGFLDPFPCRAEHATGLHPQIVEIQALATTIDIAQRFSTPQDRIAAATAACMSRKIATPPVAIATRVDVSHGLSASTKP